MTRESKLNPSKIKTQCQSAIATLEADNASLNRTKTYVSDFVNDTSIKSVSFDQLKLQCNNYVDVIDSMVTINNQDIADYITLSGTVGSETLDGNVIITNEEQYILLRDKAYAMEKMYRSMASACLIEAIASIYRMMADTYRLLGDFYEEMYQYWLAKGILYDDIEAATSGLFANSAEVRRTIGGTLGELFNSFNLDTGYNAATIMSTVLQLKYASRGDLDTANGIKALDEYLIQTGKYTEDERVEILKGISESNPYVLSDLSFIIAKEGSVAGDKLMGRIVEAYTPTHIAEAVHCREVEAEVDRWIGVADDVGDAYLKNVYDVGVKSTSNYVP